MNPWILDMWWHDVCFMHLRADAERLGRALPPGVELDLYAGDAWLSVVPFRMTDVRPRGLFTLPGFAHVPEINLRTYVRVGKRRGVWFFSLDAASRIAVRAARITTALPYFDARISSTEQNGSIAYASERRSRRGPRAAFAASYAPSGAPTVAPGDSLAAFLHERYRFFSRRGASLWTAEIAHPPWQLQTATHSIALNSLGETIGYPLTTTPDHVWFGREMHVRATATLPLG